MKKIYLLLLFVIMGQVVFGQDIIQEPSDTLYSPYSFGLAEAASDIDRYEVLYKTHLAAVDAGVGVDYTGIDTLTIEIPANARPIPLTPFTDFSGLVLTVRNTHKTLFLFELVGAAMPIDIEKDLLGGKDFTSVEALAEGTNLLLLEDENLWVERRQGRDYGATRKDVLFIHHGKAQNTPVASYLTESSSPKCFVCPVTDTLQYVRNLTFVRDTGCTYKTKLLKIRYQNNVLLENINIQTPSSTMTADAAISIYDCANITMKDVTIKGTYSRKDYYGYGIEMNNVWNSQFLRLNAQANWGIFGTNNLNKVSLRDCDINRFDVHCYGKDIALTSCKFSKLDNQFSSVYGTVKFDGCRFKDFVPVLFEPSYNAYTGFELVFQNCVFDVTRSRNFLVSAGYLDDRMNNRPELNLKCWPNVVIRNMTVNVPDNVAKVYLFNVKSPVSTKYTVRHIAQVKIDGLDFHYSGSGHAADFILSNLKVTTEKGFTCSVNKLNLLPVQDQKIEQSTTKYQYPASLGFNILSDKAQNSYTVSNSRLNYNVNTNASYTIHYTECTLGHVRFTSKSSSARRYYKNCKIYLNCNDDRRYYIDNHATYTNCRFIPCDPYRQIDFTGTNNDVVISQCKTDKNGPLFFKGHLNNQELRGFVLKGARK